MFACCSSAGSPRKGGAKAPAAADGKGEVALRRNSLLGDTVTSYERAGAASSDVEAALVAPPTLRHAPAAQSLLVAAQRAYIQVAALKADGPEVPVSPREVYRALHAVYNPAGAPHSPIAPGQPPKSLPDAADEAVMADNLAAELAALGALAPPVFEIQLRAGSASAWGTGPCALDVTPLNILM